MGIFNYTLINFIDKGLGFLAPVVVLFIVKDQLSYNAIEYILSYALLASIPIEMGFKNYLMYGLRETKESEELYYRQIFSGFIVFSFALIVASALLGLSLFNIDFIFCIAMRVVFAILTQFFMVLYRAQNDVYYIFKFTISANFSCIAYAVYCHLYGTTLNLNLYFMVYFLLALLLLISNRKLFSFLFFSIEKCFLVFKYSAPVLMNTFLMMFVSNYSRIYVHDNFTESEMSSFSFALRICMVVQLFHSSLISFYHKRLIFDMDLNLLVLCIKYFFAMLAFVGIVFSSVFIIISNYYLELFSELDILMLTFVSIYVVLWCCSSFLEIYFNKYNRNILLPIISLGSVLLFYLCTVFLLPDTINSVALSMLVSVLFVLTSYFFLINKFERNNRVGNEA